ncbi:YfmQ family protein [Priestia aryabhattai]|uniref:YfmQ family protein n=1 Tax=Priestia aryabhattai TaxID=412384 RepID=UPI00203B03A1|nr:YfmQ family protein [Priestia aryabhattai]MCM3773681.1 YfmQ family protein [Priestia aryabhattai]
MTWIVVLSIILVSALKILVTCLPTPVVKWLMTKFQLHPTLDDQNVTITVDGKHLEGKDKIQVIDYFNKATFFKQYYVHEGNKDYYKHLEDSETPLVIDTKKGKNDVRLCVYSYHDHVDVVKQYKKKIIAYSLLSDHLQKQSITADLA